MALSAAVLAVVDTAVALHAKSSSTQSVYVKNAGAQVCAVGASDVTLAGGLQLAAAGVDGVVEFEVAAGDRLYVISNATGTSVHVLRNG